MVNLTRRKETAVAVDIAQLIGAVIAGAFIAGAGTVITVGYVRIANALMKHVSRKQ